MRFTIVPRLAATAALMCSLLAAHAQEKTDSVAESLGAICDMVMTSDSICRDEMKYNTEGLFMVLSSGIQSLVQRRFIHEPEPFAVRGNHRWADYAPAATPLAAAWALKAFGVDSRSTTRRMALANGMALGFTVGLTEALKYSISEVRPDGSDHHGFPSGHAALAFMGATVLSREYGHISPWISVGGYAVATGTQMLRIRHNAHWVNDLVAGACIGTVSTHLAYYLTDRIIGRKGIRPSVISSGEQERLDAWYERPSGFRFVSGNEACSRHSALADVATDVAAGIETEGAELYTGSAITAGVEGECYLNDCFFIGGYCRATMTQSRLKLSAVNAPLAWGEMLYLMHADATAGFTIPVVKDKRVGFRALCGVRHSRECSFRSVEPVSRHLLTIPSQTRPEAGVGIVIDMLSSRSQSVGFTMDYVHTFGSDMFANRLACLSSWKVLF